MIVGLVNCGLESNQSLSVFDRTTEIMNLIIQHEYYKGLLSEKWLDRDVEQDALDSEAVEEKHYG